MGEVYRACDNRWHRNVAIRILPRRSPTIQFDGRVSSAKRRRYCALNHPNICAVYDVGTQEGIAYVVMEYIEGESVAQSLRRGPFPPATALRLTIQMAYIPQPDVDASKRLAVPQRRRDRGSLTASGAHFEGTYDLCRDPLRSACRAWFLFCFPG
jgi:serine/threonine protein kinase